MGQKDQASAGNAEPIARRNEPLPQQLNNFSGRVMDPNNKPLANANLQVLPNKTTVLTDESGSFQFTAKDSVADVQVSHIGFEQRNFRLQNNIASNNIVLEPQKESLDEVVVTGYGTQRKKEVTKATVKVQDAVPQIGWVEYEKYLEQNKKPPANNPLMKGEVVVSFQIKRPAILSDFKIEKSLSKEYDAEAIRLVKEGPAWKLLRGDRTSITVIVKF
ncbi:MAG: carboxypeptidase-like regulatory domain-containing protein [Flavitalea sp.]